MKIMLHRAWFSEIQKMKIDSRDGTEDAKNSNRYPFVTIVLHAEC